jgi:hypothetical protein
VATKVLNRIPELDNIRQFGVFDDFCGATLTNSMWTTTIADTAAAAAYDADGVGGVLTLSAGTSDNGEAYIETNELFKFAVDKPLIAVARLKFTPVSADAGAIIFGLSDAPGANSIQDDEAGPDATYHGAFIFKNSGAATLSVECTGSAAGTQQTATTGSSMVSASWESFMIVVEPVSATDKRVTYYHDPNGGQAWKQLKDTNGQLIQHTVSLTDQGAGTGEMALMAGIKNASAGEAQTLDIDYIGCWQLR